ncbi:MAG: CHAT domain-containing tetratricopeptide repeat protein [Thermoanaerobaculia bacterium]|nr:CHAT domain-containing tetratricopeptide repeat protein [Thermoanaerobaculia bacterium]
MRAVVLPSCRRWLVLFAVVGLGPSPLCADAPAVPEPADNVVVSFDTTETVSLPIPGQAGDWFSVTADQPPGAVEILLWAPGVDPCPPRVEFELDPVIQPVARGEQRATPGLQVLETAFEWTGTHQLVLRSRLPGALRSVTLQVGRPRTPTLTETLGAEAMRAFRRGEFWFRNRGESAAKRDFETAMIFAQAAGDRRARGWASLGAGLAELEWKPAVPHFEAALAHFRGTGDRLGEIEALRLLGTAAGELADPSESDRQFQAAFDGATVLEDPGLAIDILVRWARSLGGTPKRFEDAGLRLESAAQLAASWPDPELQFHIGFWLGTIERSRFRLEPALERFQSVLAQAPTPYDRARTLSGIGLVYDDLGEFQLARLATIQAVSTLEQIHLVRSQIRDLGSTLEDLGNISHRLGDWPKMFESYRLALARLPPSEQLLRARVQRNLAWALAHVGRHQEALVAADEALRLSRDPAESAISRGMFGEVLLAQAGDDPQGVGHARRYLEAALGEYAGLPRPAPGPLARLYEFVGEADRRLGRFTEARASLSKALEVHESIGSLIDIAFDHYYLARVERQRGDLALAQDHAQHALDTYQQLRARVGHSEAQASFASARPREVQEFFVDLLMERHEREPEAMFDRQAFLASERARGQSLLDLVAQGPPQARDVPASLLAAREAVRRAIQSLEIERRAFAQKPPAEAAYARWNNELVSQESELQRIDGQIRRLDPGYDALVSTEPASVEEIQALLDKDTVLLEYLLGDARSFLWVVTPQAVRAFPLAPRKELEASALAFHRTVTQWGERPVGGLREFRAPLLERSAQLAAELGRQLLGPAGDLIGQKHLVIVADGALEYIPFAALREPVTQATLIENHVVTRLPSASILAVQRRLRSGDRVPVRQTLAIFADPTYTAQPRLEFSRQEAERIRTVTPDPPVLRLGPEASREAALTTDLSQFRYLHFAVHGKIDAEFPNFSKLVLAERDGEGRAVDGDLTLTDIYGLTLGADLVVLSACDTALGKNVRGEGLLGLTRGFLYAGAGSVLSTLWQVQDEATTRLMERFYHALFDQGLPPADALRFAQLEMLRLEERKFPYYWAAFVLQGEWR